MTYSLLDFKILNEGLTKFLRWGDFKSTDKNRPDIIELECGESTDTFLTEFSTCIKAKMNNEDINIPLKSNTSANPQPLKAFMEYVDSGKIKAGQFFQLLTFKGTSKNDRPIRRFAFAFQPNGNGKQSSLFYSEVS